MVSDKVAVEESKQLRDYELVLVISPGVEEEEFEAIIDNVSRFITGKGGIISDIERWGKRRLAYPRHRQAAPWSETGYIVRLAYSK